MNNWETKNILVVVKAYPSLSTKYGETVCVAGITEDNKFIRLYPVRFRDMPFDKWFHKYQWIKLRVQKHTQDNRPESYRPDLENIQPGEIIGTDKDPTWSKRKKYVMPLVSGSMCEIIEEASLNKKSLGIFKPKEIISFDVTLGEEEWKGKKQTVADQRDLFSQKKTSLEKIPCNFKYSYICNSVGCKGHNQVVVDWEAGQLYRNLRDNGESPEDIIKKMKKKFGEQVMGPKRDTYFFVGSHSLYHESFMVLGIFWPAKV
ncbi:MAG: hypothetical protein Q8O12_03745 [Candidatus Omnitrophota bacterium]|nr:hypothetical protein [Candidatus Omnitrophota bacterium]